MTSLLTNLFGLDSSALNGARWHDLSLRWLGLPSTPAGGWWTVAILALVGFLVWNAIRQYRLEGSVISTGWRRALTILRLGALGVALVILFQPTLVVDRSERLKSTVWVLLDDSLSMSLQEGDATARKSRLDLVRTQLAQHKLIEELTNTHQLRVAAFSDGWREVTTNDLATLTPQGTATSLAQGLRQTIESSRGQPIAAMVLITDGQATDGETMSAAEFASQRGVPVYTVGVGNPKPPKNIEVASVTANPVLFKDDETVFTVRIVARELAGTTAKVTLREESRSESAKGSVIAEETIKLPPNDQPMEVTLRAKPQQLGTFSYTANIEPLPDELTDRDNSASLVARVIGRKPHVLFIAGNASKEYRYLKNHFTRDPTLSVSCWLQSAEATFNQEGDTPLTKLPRTEQELNGYDVIFMLDPDPREFDESWAKLLDRFVGDHGGGFAFIASNKFTTDFLSTRELAPIAQLLPVQVEREQLSIAEALNRVNQQEWPWLLTAAGNESPMFQLDSDSERNRRIWAAMPGFYWSQPVRTLKPGASALAVHSDPRRQTRQGPQPIVATQFYGPGRVLFVASDSTWRWRYVGARAFDQFWSQTVRYLTEGRLIGGQKRVVLTTDRDDYSLGQRITIRARVLDSNYKPVTDGNFEVRVAGGANAKTTAQQAVVRLEPVAGATGEFEGSFLAEQLGLYELSATPPKALPHDEPVTKAVRISLPRLEFADPRMNEPLLRDIASTTGGDFFPLSEIGRLSERLPKREQVLTNEQTHELWDTPLAMLTFCGLLFTEWALRKWKNLA